MKHEWIYFWGRLSTGEFFHFARFNNESKRYSHLSLDGIFYEGDWVAGKHFFTTPQFKLGAEPFSNHIMHYASSSYYYYSIPFLSGVAQIDGKKMTADLWFDFESTIETEIGDWEWISLKLSNQMAILIYKRERNAFAKLILGDKVVSSSFLIEGDEISLCDLGLTYRMEVLKPEIIFYPTNGRPYSEQPFEVSFKGRRIGFGMRERTYNHKQMEE
jgi:hypothetical protein